MCPQYFKPGHLESNQDQRIQSPVCCHCTMPQRSQYFSIVFKPCKQLPAPIHRLGLSHACHPSFCLSALLNRPRRSCARSGDYPSVSRWAQAAQSGFVDTVLIVKGYYHVWVLKRGSNGLPDFRTPYAKCSNFFMAATMISILTWWLASIRLFRSMTIGL